MPRLELKAPPDVVWVLVAGLMWVASMWTPRLDVSLAVRARAAVVLAGAGVWAIVNARILLRRANTTWRPSTPSHSTTLVTSGVYAYSRNPMYLGMLLVLLGWAAWLGSPAALVLSTAFAVYIDRFQIGPEERALAAILGQAFVDYQAHVRRWL